MYHFFMHSLCLHLHPQGILINGLKNQMDCVKLHLPLPNQGSDRLLLLLPPCSTAPRGGFGALNVYQRPAIPVPYPPPAGDFTLLVGDWFATPSPHADLKQTLDTTGVSNGGGTYTPTQCNANLPAQRQQQIYCPGADPAKKTYLSRSTNSGSSKPKPGTASPFNGHFPPH